jgi:hypothetical protein
MRNTPLVSPFFLAGILSLFFFPSDGELAADLSAFFHVAKNQNLTITIFNYILVTFFDSV